MKNLSSRLARLAAARGGKSLGNRRWMSSISRPSAHSWAFIAFATNRKCVHRCIRGGHAGEWVEKARPATETHAELLRLPDGAMRRSFRLTLVREIAAAAAHKSGAAVKAELRDAPTACVSIGYAYALKPRTVSAEVAWCPLDRHALLDGFPRLFSYAGRTQEHD